MSIPTDLVSVKEAAQIAGFAVDTLYRYISAGRIPSYGVTRRHRISLADVLPCNRAQRGKYPHWMKQAGKLDIVSRAGRTPGEPADDFPIASAVSSPRTRGKAVKAKNSHSGEGDSEAKSA